MIWEQKERITKDQLANDKQAKDLLSSLSIIGTNSCNPGLPTKVIFNVPQISFLSNAL